MVLWPTVRFTHLHPRDPAPSSIRSLGVLPPRPHDHPLARRELTAGSGKTLPTQSSIVWSRVCRVVLCVSLFWVFRVGVKPEQKCHEWGIKMWIATIDFTKASDSITHKSIWKALNSCGINHEYISLLKKTYKDHKASAQTDVESNMFEIKKGTKQGDPLSSLLFIAVLRSSLKEVTQRWQKEKGMGIYLSDHDRDCLTNLRFADDVLLFAASKEQLQKNDVRIQGKC